MLTARACCTALPLSAGVPFGKDGERPRGLAIIGGLSNADVGTHFDEVESRSDGEDGSPSEQSTIMDIFAEMFDFNTQRWVALPPLPGLLQEHVDGPYGCVSI